MKTEPVGGMHFMINAFALRVFLAVYWEMANYKGSISAAFSRSGGERGLLSRLAACNRAYVLQYISSRHETHGSTPLQECC